MALAHQTAHCTGRWQRHGPHAWHCTGCGAVVEHSADAEAVITADNLLASRFRGVPAEERVNGGTRTPRERRHSRRVELQFPVESVLLGNALAGVRQFSTETLDLSEGGARIRVPEELPLGQRLGLHVRLPNGGHRCRARVLRSAASPDRVGQTGAWAAVQFVEPAVEMQTAIAELISVTEKDRSDGAE